MKGKHVRIVKGRKGKDKTGKVFWEGPDRFKEGSTRLGIEGDDGETYWVSADYVEELAADEVSEILEQIEQAIPEDIPKGTWVRWKKAGDEGTGRVFWFGDGKRGGKRVGVEDEESGESLWFDVRQVEITDEPAGSDDEDDDDDDDEVPF